MYKRQAYGEALLAALKAGAGRPAPFTTCFAPGKKMMLRRFSATVSYTHLGAQDFDLILRLTERAQKVAHVPKVLYWWRGHGGSTASGMQAKPCLLYTSRCV